MPSRWAAACALAVQLALLCADLPQARSGTWATQPTQTPTPTSTEAPTPTEAPTEAPTPTATDATETPETTTTTTVATVSPGSLQGDNAVAVADTDADADASASEPASATSASGSLVCTAEQLATLATLNDGNPYLRSTCSSDGGDESYVFPTGGKPTYAQMVAMSGSAACEVYFLAVLLVVPSECDVSDVFVRSTAEVILSLALETSGYPSESQLDAALAARITDYSSSLSSSSSSSSSSPVEWAMPSASELQQQFGMDLIVTEDLQVVGTAYSGSDNGEQSGQQAAATSVSSSSSSSAALVESNGSQAAAAVASLSSGIVVAAATSAAVLTAQTLLKY